MTQQYNRSLLAPVVILPTGQRQPYSQILDYDYNVTTSNKITINRVAGSAIDFTPNNPTSVMAQLDKIPSMTASLITIGDDSLAWTSVTPSTYTIGNPDQGYAIVGTGFISAGINAIKFDDGAGHQQILSVGFGLTITSSTEIDAAPFSFDDVGVFTIYYSVDNGSTWITTGLTVTTS